MKIVELVALLERIAALPLPENQRTSLMHAAIAENDGSPTIPRIARTSRYGEPMRKIVETLEQSDDWLSAREISILSGVDPRRVGDLLTKLFTTDRIVRMDGEPSADRGSAAPGRTTVYIYKMKARGA